MPMNKLSLANPIITAPMAGVSDRPFRKIIAQFNAGLIFTEMVSVEGIIRSQPHTLKLIDISGEPANTGIQLFGNSPEKIRDAIIIIQEKFRPKVIDINMGCPVKKIVKDGCGAALLRDIKKIAQILKKITDVCKSYLTIKIRSGWSATEINYLEVGKIAEYYDISAITLHPRTAAQLYAGKANWSHIMNLKKNIKIPVVGNGDILNVDDYLAKKEFCDFIMVGRGLLYNPFLIKQILENDKNSCIDSSQKKQLYLKHLELLVEEYGERKAVRHFRKYFGWYVRHIKNAKFYRTKGFACESYLQFANLISESELV